MFGPDRHRHRSSSEMYKNHVVFGEATGHADGFIFFKRRWTLPERKQIYIDKFVSDRALRTDGETGGAGSDA